MMGSLPKEALICFDCGTCTSLCRVAYIAESNPRLFKWCTKEDLRSNVFKCTLCGRCKEECPRGVDTKQLLLSLREYLFKERLLPRGILQMSNAVEREKNVADFPNMERGMWADFLDVPLEMKEGAEVLYFVGCMGSFSPAAQSVPQSVATLLQRIGIDFMILAEREYCCGYPLLVAGMREKMSSLIEHNSEEIKKCGAKKVLFSCPSCYYTFSNIYNLDIELLHYTEYLLTLYEEGKLSFSIQKPMRLTYHDPCDLGRGMGVYEAPRQLLSAIEGVEFFEMRKNRAMAYCCGGGGDLEIVDVALAERIASSLIDEVLRMNVEVLITACQQCKRTLQKAAKNFKVMDISEILLLAFKDGDKRM